MKNKPMQFLLSFTLLLSGNLATADEVLTGKHRPSTLISSVSTSRLHKPLPETLTSFGAAVVAILGRVLVADEHAHHQHDGAKDHVNVVKSIHSGRWSAAETWNTKTVPAAGAKVLIQRGHEVTYDTESAAVIRGIQVSGTLRFATDQNTLLNVGLIRIEDVDDYSEEGFECEHATLMDESPRTLHPSLETGVGQHAALEIGRPEGPLPAEFQAVIRLHFVEGMNRESCPAIVCCGGRMDLHGAILAQTWVKLPFQSARVGEARIVMPAELPGWKVGDKIVIAGTTRQSGYLGTRTGVPRSGPTAGDNSVTDNPASEERTITALRPWRDFDSRYQIISLNEPLKFDHFAADNHRAEVANLSRNVIIESADPEGVRGHTMYHAGSKGSISYAEFRHLGKRDVLGRYPIHFHLVEDSMRGSSVVGVSVWDSHNRWITIHGTQYLVVRDCIGYQSVGHGYFLEDGTEVYNVLDHNLALQAFGGKPLPKQVLPYDRNLGSGFWWANSLNTFTRNSAVECDEDGYRFEAVESADFDPKLSIRQPDGSVQKVDIRTLPFVRFDSNEAHCQRLFGINLGGFSQSRINQPDGDVEGVGPDFRHPFVLRNSNIWDTHWAFHCGSPCVRIEGMNVFDCFYGMWRCVLHRHEHRGVTFTDVDTPMFFPRAIGDANYDYSIKEYFDLDPVDDLPPITVITHAFLRADGLLDVRGVTSDNYDVAQVLVNGQPVRATRENFAEWEITLPQTALANDPVSAFAIDKAGNTEQTPHILRTLVESPKFVAKRFTVNSQ